MAAFKKQSGRQGTVVAVANFDFSQLVSGVFLPMIELPSNAVVTGGGLNTYTAFNSVTSDAATVGDATLGTRYAASQSIHALGRVPLIATGVKASTLALRNVGITWTGVGTAPTAGAGSLEVHYYVPGRSNFSQGLDK